jgi:hypothetical protein
MDDFEVGKDYGFDGIEKVVDNNDFELEDLGSYSVGKNFLSVTDHRDNVASFVLSGANLTQGIYKCVYNE